RYISIVDIELRLNLRCIGSVVRQRELRLGSCVSGLGGECIGADGIGRQREVDGIDLHWLAKLSAPDTHAASRKLTVHDRPGDGALSVNVHINVAADLALRVESGTECCR